MIILNRMINLVSCEAHARFRFGFIVFEVLLFHKDRVTDRHGLCTAGYPRKQVAPESTKHMSIRQRPPMERLKKAADGRVEVLGHRDPRPESEY